jgi:hypothetical protein
MDFNGFKSLKRALPKMEYIDVRHLFGVLRGSSFEKAVPAWRGRNFNT